MLKSTAKEKKREREEKKLARRHLKEEQTLRCIGVLERVERWGIKMARK